MTKQEVLTRILTNRINTDKVSEITDFTEIKNTLDIFLAGGSIISEQYEELIEMITPAIQTTV
ncbi:hypothetical protein [Clostridium diolis]|uniref:hypothetical protein n=1 Tax=Clostridium diolis TaxID=223919 RepID=UPI003AF4EB55